MTRQVQALAALLLFAAVIYFMLYGYAVVTTFAGRGAHLMAETQAWYVALAPMVFALFCIFSVYSLRWMRVKILGISGIVLAFLVVPSISEPFFGLGRYLPIIILLWAVFMVFVYKAATTRPR